MKRKAQGLPINMIIISALALIVLVVTIVIFTKGSSTFTSGALSCQSKGGNCIADKEKCDYEKTSFSCPREKPVCCLNPLSR